MEEGRGLAPKEEQQLSKEDVAKAFNKDTEELFYTPFSTKTQFKNRVEEWSKLDSKYAEKAVNDPKIAEEDDANPDENDSDWVAWLNFFCRSKSSLEAERKMKMAVRRARELEKARKKPEKPMFFLAEETWRQKTSKNSQAKMTLVNMTADEFNKNENINRFIDAIVKSMNNVAFTHSDVTLDTLNIIEEYTESLLGGKVTKIIVPFKLEFTVKQDKFEYQRRLTRSLKKGKFIDYLRGKDDDLMEEDDGDVTEPLIKPTSSFSSIKIDNLKFIPTKMTDRDYIENMGTQIKLQLYYRKAVEFRVANSLEAADMQFKSMICTALILILSTIVSALLLIGSSSTIVTIGAILSAFITALTGFSSYMNYAGRYEQHAMTVAAFANLQRKILNLIQTGTPEDQREDFQDIADEFNGARNEMPMLLPERIESYTVSDMLSDERKEELEAMGYEDDPKLFKLITDKELISESQNNVRGMSRALRLFPKPKEDSESLLYTHY
jgi:hypothetical protein